MSKLETDQIGANLKVAFGNDISKEPFFGRWCELGAFLTDSPEVLKAMAELDKRMFEKLCNKKALDINGVGNRAMVTQAYSAYQAKSTGVSLAVTFSKSDVTHLLSNLLTANEANFHFTTATGHTQEKDLIAVNRTTPVDSRSHVPTYHGFVQPEVFMAQLRKKSHWKDPGAQRTHGEYAHRLQWFALTYGLWNSGSTASDVFESIGTYAGKFDRGATESARYLYLWDALCDRTNGVDVSFSNLEFLTSDGPGRGNDFRSPENLNIFLLENEGFESHRWPLMKLYLQARKSKREPQFQASYEWNEKKKKVQTDWDDPMYYFQATYLSKKLYAKTYEEIESDPGKLSVIKKLVFKSDQIWKF